MTLDHMVDRPKGSPVREQMLQEKNIDNCDECD